MLEREWRTPRVVPERDTRSRPGVRSAGSCSRAGIWLPTVPGRSTPSIHRFVGANPFAMPVGPSMVSEGIIEGALACPSAGKAGRCTTVSSPQAGGGRRRNVCSPRTPFVRFAVLMQSYRTHSIPTPTNRNLPNLVPGMLARSSYRTGTAVPLRYRRYTCTSIGILLNIIRVLILYARAGGEAAERLASHRFAALAPCTVPPVHEAWPSYARRVRM